MLFKTPYKTAEELGISEEEIEAMLWVREKLLDGTLPHFDKADDGNRFNMGDACDASYSSDCGTIACIGGWMSIYMQRKGMKVRIDHDHNELIYLPSALQAKRVSNYVNGVKYNWMGRLVSSGQSKELHRLFFPLHDLSVSYSDITPEQAAQAIDNYLMTGSPDWKQAVASAEGGGD